MQKYIDRFWTKVNKTQTCWEWTGATTKFGHGMFSYSGKTLGAHRFSALISGMAIDGKLVCHHCDNPRCVRPDHLFIGDHITNMRDMVNKKRHMSREIKKMKTVYTPLGVYPSRVKAAIAHGITPPAISYRMLTHPALYYYG